MLLDCKSSLMPNLKTHVQLKWEITTNNFCCTLSTPNWNENHKTIWFYILYIAIHCTSTYTHTAIEYNGWTYGGLKSWCFKKKYFLKTLEGVKQTRLYTQIIHADLWRSIYNKKCWAHTAWFFLAFLYIIYKIWIEWILN